MEKWGAMVWFVVGVILAAAGAGAGQGSLAALPPAPYEDVGACPFEGCVYREWVAREIVTVLRTRDPGSQVAFTLEPGDRVQAITGIVITHTPGRVQFRKAIDLWTTEGTLHVEPGETLYLLTYQGEGHSTAWFKGRLYDQVDGSEFFNGLCELKPGTCNGTILEKPIVTWWVRVRSRLGVTGWIREPEKFDKKDALG